MRRRIARYWPQAVVGIVAGAVVVAPGFFNHNESQAACHAVNRFGEKLAVVIERDSRSQIAELHKTVESPAATPDEKAQAQQRLDAYRDFLDSVVSDNC
jgi:hypothetical protein